jgi:hypothetical protein
VLLLFAGAHNISLKYLFPEKMFIEVLSAGEGEGWFEGSST